MSGSSIILIRLIWLNSIGHFCLALKYGYRFIINYATFLNTVLGI